MTQRRNIDVNPFNSLTSILILVLIFVGLYFVAKTAFTLLSWVAPILLLGALIIDYNVVLNYGKWLFNLLKENFLMGIGAVMLTVFGFPVIAGFLFGKALLYRKVGQLKQEFETKTQGEFVEFEEIEEENVEETPKLELPPLSKRKERVQNENEYEDLFD